MEISGSEMGFAMISESGLPFDKLRIKRIMTDVRM